MKQIVTLGIFLIFSGHLFAENAVERYVFETNRDTIWFKYGTNYPEKYPMSILKDTIQWELHYNYMSDGKPHDFVFYAADKWLLVPHSDKVIEVTFISPPDTGVLQIYFVGSTHDAAYQYEYIAGHTNQAKVEIPEVFELANIAIAINNYGLENPNRVIKDGDYYQRVLDHFMPYKNHPLIAQIEFSDQTISVYYSFRDNAFRYRFQGSSIVEDGQYSFVRWPDIFAVHLKLVEDFASKSHFREFYQDNTSYYNQLIEEYHRKIPLQQMWTWLENNFDNTYESYKVVFSPLIKASHETVRFEGNGFHETIMFVNGPKLYQEKYSGVMEEAMLSVSVFTEIDHNYVNPTADWYIDEINKAFSDVNTWNEGNSGYGSPSAIFLEYMTWAVFLLYAHDKYQSDDFDQIKPKVVEMMTEWRGFIFFKEFAEELLSLYISRSDGENVSPLFPQIIAWSAEQR